MNFISQIERLQTLNKLIKQGSTGTPTDLAKRFKISKRQVYNLIEELKLMGLDIRYSKRRQTYYYVKGQGLEIKFSVNILTDNELQKIHGACLGKYSGCNFISPYGHTFIPILV